jgi:hypothetical protein
LRDRQLVHLLPLLLGKLGLPIVLVLVRDVVVGEIDFWLLLVLGRRLLLCRLPELFEYALVFLKHGVVKVVLVCDVVNGEKVRGLDRLCFVIAVALWCGRFALTRRVTGFRWGLLWLISTMAWETRSDACVLLTERCCFFFARR